MATQRWPGLASARILHEHGIPFFLIEICAKVAARAGELRGVEMIYRPPCLPHFTAKFRPIVGA